MRKNGFTIVELLIVVVVIAILAAISVVAYIGVQSRARNNTTSTAVSTYYKTFALYAATYSRYPTLSQTYNCLGQSTCRGGTWFANATLDSALREFTSVLPAPSNGTNTDSSSGIVSLGYIDISANVTVNGTARYLLIYALEGVISCTVGPVVSGAWPTYYSTPPPDGRTGGGATVSTCITPLPIH